MFQKKTDMNEFSPKGGRTLDTQLASHALAVPRGSEESFSIFSIAAPPQFSANVVLSE
jgi:hypothetical protein